MSNMYCGVDIGGTKCSIALINAEGDILDKIYSCDHVGLNEGEVVQLLAGQVRKILNRNELKETDLPGIGMGCAGHIRYRDGVIITTSNLRGFKNFPLREAFQSHFSIPVFLDNDTNAQALAEHRFGAGQGFEDMVFVTLSTGIGAGIIIHNKLFRGATGTAGEFGHSIVEPGSELICTCGNRGCLMACACGLALPHLFEKKLKEGKKSSLDLPPDYPLSRISGKELKLGLDLGDPVTMDVISESGYYVGVGLYNLFQVLNPSLFVLGGGLTNWGDFYLDKIRSTFFELARDMIFDPIEIRLSKIAEDAGVIGAAALTLESID